LEAERCSSHQPQGGHRMKLHGNARTCPKSRRLLVERVESMAWSVTTATEAAGLQWRHWSRGRSRIVSRLVLGIAGGCVLGMLLLPGGAAAAKRPTCEMPRSKTYLANRAVRVFTTRHRAETSLGPAVDTVLRACLRRDRRPFELARSTAVDTAGYREFANVALSGRHVALTARSCDRHGMFCAGGVRVWNVRTRRLVRSTDETWASDLELHPNGSVAWITAPLAAAAPAITAAVRVNDGAGERTLAAGAIAPDSLALGGSMLYWTEDGVPHASALQ
jgi:hypothetical protein